MPISGSWTRPEGGEERPHAVEHGIDPGPQVVGQFAEIVSESGHDRLQPGHDGIVEHDEHGVVGGDGFDRSSNGLDEAGMDRVGHGGRNGMGRVAQPGETPGHNPDTRVGEAEFTQTGLGPFVPHDPPDEVVADAASSGGEIVPVGHASPLSTASANSSTERHASSIGIPPTSG